MNRISLKERVYGQIRRSRRNVFVRADFSSLSDDYDQVGRALHQLVGQKILIKLGYGVYAKAKINPYTGKPMIKAKGGFNQVSKEALKRLDVKYKDVDYEIVNEQHSTQVAANTVVRIKGRFNRKIGIDDKFELRVI